MSNAAFINALMEEGTKQDCLEQVVKLWNENCELRNQLVRANDLLRRTSKQIIGPLKECNCSSCRLQNDIAIHLTDEQGSSK